MSISYFLQRNFLKTLFLPSHNRGQALPKEIINLLSKRPGSWDLPDLPEIGTNLSQKGLVAEAQNYFSEKFKVKNCFFGVNGATGLIQASILTMAKPGDYILVPRNVHNCVIKICTLVNIIPIFFDVPFDEETGHYKPITSTWLKNILNQKLLKNKKIAGAILVNPYYQGYATKIDHLIEILHQEKIPVLVDEAHGSYFLFCEDMGFPTSAIRSKADLVVHSLHKSLNGLTQTAILWSPGDNIKQSELADNLNLLQTSSQSSLLLSSCEESIKDWLNQESLKKYKKRISEADRIFENLVKKGIPLIKTQDPLKIVLNTGIIGIDGFTADQFFYKNGLMAELPELTTLTFCLGFARQNDFVNLLSKLWDELLAKKLQRTTIKPLKPPFPLVQIPEVSPSIAWRKDSFKVPLELSVGKISAEIICPYPPGIPLIVPGEKIDKERINWLQGQSIYNNDLVNSYIKVF
ncbi:MAG: decarboxylase [Prochlorococcus sp. SP3034]|nr:decarboxylase [Prochlorococcus sp. SP3034]|tara:strand:+ start:3513 stop:4904 length:1392 start_codon:yes stop_codon:yes gene_type:complete